MKQHSTGLKLTTPSDREIVVRRVFDAPRALVFDALTKPELLRRWFSGPPGWTFEVCEMSPVAGSTYRYVWASPEGMRMGISGVIQEVVVPERIVATEQFDEAWYPGGALDTTELVELDGKTVMTMTILYDTKEARDIALQSPMESGMEYGYGKLAELLETLLVEEHAR